MTAVVIADGAEREVFGAAAVLNDGGDNQVTMAARGVVMNSFV